MRSFRASVLALVGLLAASATASFVAVGGSGSPHLRGQEQDQQRQHRWRRSGSRGGRSGMPLAFMPLRAPGAGSARMGGSKGHGAAAAGPQQPRAARVTMQETDLYRALGVPRNAKDGDIKKAYRAAARKWHPDVNPSDDAKEKFQGINEAYQVLSNPELRQRYDQFGMAGIKGAAGGGGGPNMQDFDFGDIFESFFSGVPNAGTRARSSRPTQGDDLRFDLELDFKTALFGGEKKIRITQLEACTTCGGSGVAPGASVTTCSTCGGRGSVTQTVNTILGRMQQQSICPTCGGTGSVVEKYCGSCDGRGTTKRSKQLTVTIPPGVENGNRLRVRGEGDAGPKGGPSGDLYVFLSVARDPNFRREGMDLYSEVPVSYVDAILGTTLKVDTVDGNAVDVALPAGTQPGATLRLEGKGAPKLNNVNMRGSHFVKINVQIPKSLSSKERELVMQLRKL